MNEMNIKHLSLEQKIGQMFMFGFYGDKVPNSLKYLITKKYLGNVIVFARNFRNASILRSLTIDLHQEFAIPPLIGIDQEGGVVTRITDGATIMPGNMAVSSSGDPGLAFEYGRIIGRELRALGINLNLAPVLDVNRKTNPGMGVRSFGETPDDVVDYSTEMIKGLQAEFIFATGKHFPGIGAAELDTHIDMPVINSTLAELEDIDLMPFRSAILNGIDCIMTSHAAFPAFLKDNENTPATFCREIMTDYLREKMGFKGVLITDDLEMGAVEKSMSFREIILSAVRAGADILCICHDFEKQKKALEIVLNAVKTGDISESSIDESVIRIFELKNKFNKSRDFFLKDDIDEIVSGHKESADDILEKSIRILNREKKKTLNDSKVLVVIPKLKEYTKVEELKPVIENAERAILENSMKFIKEIETSGYTLPPEDAEIADIISRCSNSGAVIICSYNAHLDSRQKEMITAIYKANRELMLLMLRDPYDVNILEKEVLAVAVYAPLVPNIECGLRKLLSPL